MHYKHLIKTLQHRVPITFIIIKHQLLKKKLRLLKKRRELAASCLLNIIKSSFIINYIIKR